MSKMSKPHVFLSTLSLRRATCQRELHRQDIPISIHALLAESDNSPRATMHTWKISIHALLAESDRGVNLFRFQTVISIHALLAESDPIQAPPYKYNDISIHALLAESDESKQGRHYIGCNFYPRSPCGERRECQQERRRMCQFLSTLSLRRATLPNAVGLPVYCISIHALLAESDSTY